LFSSLFQTPVPLASSPGSMRRRSMDRPAWPLTWAVVLLTGAEESSAHRTGASEVEIPFHADV
jgi:hypothetical protein